jgi:hypothetical protein
VNIPDITNGVFELIGGAAVWANVFAIRKDKGYAGVRVPVMVFFSSWSLWNIYYYPHLGQYWSLAGGASIGLANLAFVCSMLYYGRK